MEARNQTKARTERTPDTFRQALRLDAMQARSAGEVLGVLDAAPDGAGGKVPTGLWKTGWLAQAGTESKVPTGLWKTGWLAQPGS